MGYCLSDNRELFLGQKPVFGRLVRLDPFVQGIGLGLAICEMIVRKMKAGSVMTPNPAKMSNFGLPYRINLSNPPENRLIS